MDPEVVGSAAARPLGSAGLVGCVEVVVWWSYHIYSSGSTTTI